MHEPEQLQMFDPPAGGRVEPIEAPPPSWSREVWLTLRTLSRLSNGQVKEGTNARLVANLTGIKVAEASDALQLLGAYGLAHHDGTVAAEKWFATPRTKSTWTRWAPVDLR